MTAPHSADPAAIAEYLVPRIDRELAVFQSLQHSPIASPSYELMSDAIYWDDEVPTKSNPDVVAIMRHILRSRVELAQWGGSDPTWDHLKKQVPTWPGFRPERCGGALLELYAQGRSEKQLADE